jgi:transposase
MDCDSPFSLMEMVMARALSDDLRVRVLEAGAAGGSARSLAKRFGIGISTAIRWLRRERESGERTGAQMMFLPPYSPDFNPIEMAFVKLKALLRAKAARTVTTLWDAAGSVLDAFTPDKCANFLTAAGYEPE